MDCGPACLRMVAKYYDKSVSLEYLRTLSYLSKQGVSLLSLTEAAEKIGFKAMAVKIDKERLIKDCPLPCILHWDQTHFVVLYDIKKTLWGKRQFRIADPGHGIITIDEKTLERGWFAYADFRGTALLIEPGIHLDKEQMTSEEEPGLFFIYKYLTPYIRYILMLLIGMIAASGISLVLPFLMQLLVDKGISQSNIHVIYLVMAAQLCIFLGATAIDMIQKWLLLHVGARISLSIISTFLSKLLRLPVSYFDSKTIGDIAQRIQDHNRIETFLTTATLGSLFSFINIIVFSIVLGMYSLRILGIFWVFSLLSIAWILLFQRKRKDLDYKKFMRSKESQDNLYEMMEGIQEIKLYGSETPRRWEWERLQVNLFKLNISSLALEQYQRTGFIFILQLKNILITFLAAMAVMEGHATLGVLLSISYIIGQTNAPIEQLTVFIKSAQDARLSINRMQEIHGKENEDAHIRQHQQPAVISGADIHLQNISFQYEGPHSPFVLKDIDLLIPNGKMTAIVGASGSGKTTLMKLLLGFYTPVQGNIFIGEHNLQEIDPKRWRHECGTVMQHGYLFSDTIARNIALDGNDISHERMQLAVRTANIRSFIERLPLQYTTKIGNSGIGLSGGQRQRLLIARAVYKDPSFIFFDEATSALDAQNERIIMENLYTFFQGRTVVVIAHRLSTVKDADQIIVLKEGRIVETGNHVSLTADKGEYYHLVKNQLELGN